jgi:hypothetical protein
MLLIPVANLLLVLLTPHQCQFATGINNTSGTGGKLAVGIVDISAKFVTGIKTNGTGGKICLRCR